MDIDSFKTAFELGGQALSLLKGAKDLLPQSPQKDAVSKSILEAEKAFQIAEAQAAKELGYELCQCTWPPQIKILSQESSEILCPNCKRSGQTKLVPISTIPESKSITTSDELTEDEKTVIKTLFDLGDEGYEINTLAHHLKMPVPKVEYYIEKLEGLKYIGGSHSMMTESTYHLAQKGREYLIKSGIM
jgi:hypothetical protein